MSNRQVIGMIGGILLVLGVFFPMVSIPMMGSITFLNNGSVEGMLVIVFGILSIILSVTKQCSSLVFTGFASGGVDGYVYFNLQDRISSIRNSMSDQLEGNPFRGLADTFVNSVQIQWGFAFLLLGVILLLISSFLKDENSIDKSIIVDAVPKSSNDRFSGL